jgi:hypothetical protein
VEATRDKEIQAMLKCDRDNQWPLRITVSSRISEKVSASITYLIGWEGCTSTEEWLRTQLSQAATEDGLSELPVVLEGREWGFMLRKENNSFRAISCEQGVDTPKRPGLPTLNLYGPHSEVKARALSLETYEGYANGGSANA